MKPEFEYKGYFGSVEINTIDNILHGKLLFINDIVTYTAQTPKELETAFREAVDDYLQTCAELGDEPNVPFKDSLNILVGHDRHKIAAFAAIQNNISLNDWICRAIDNAATSMMTKTVKS